MSSGLREQLRKQEQNQHSVIELADLATVKKLFQSHKDFFFIIDLHGIIIDTNEAIEHVTGYQQEEWVDKPFSHFISKVEQVKFASSINLIKKRERQVETCSLIHKEGHQIEFEKTSIPITHDQKIFGFLAIGRDVTDVKKQERELKKVRASLNHVQLIGNTGSWNYDVNKDVAHWSNHLYQMFGVEEKETFTPTYNSFLSIIHPLDREKCHTILLTSLQNGSSFQFEFHLLRPDGVERMISMQGDVIIDEDGKPIRMVGTFQDITEQKEMEQKLKDSEEQKRLIYDNLDVAIWSVDHDTNQVLFLTKGFETIYGYANEEMKNDRDLWLKVIHPDDYKPVMEKQKELLSGKAIRHQYRIYHKSGAIKWVQDHTLPVLDHGGRLVRLDGVISDITDQKQAEERMSYLAHHDMLTGLPNRRRFDQVLQRYLTEKSAERFAILYFNLDRFKHINDTLGHVIGDDLLVEVAKRLNYLNPEKECLSRMDGDEFAIFLSDVSEMNRPELLAERVLKIIQKPFLIEGYELYITVSIGISIFSKNGETADDLMNQSIAAMNRAKQLGKNNYQLYSSTMGEGSIQILSMENDMRKALKNDEFSVYYQPRVCTKTGKIASAEALIRWTHPEKGFMSPGEFIPLAEENGLIFEISDWVAVQVCKQIKRWQEEHIPVIPISINVSAQSFLKKDLVPKLKALLAKTEINPAFIELEITESSYLNNMDLVIQALLELRQMGVKIALDDFGTGFSSLTHLKELHIDTLKIDRSFIRNIVEKEPDRVITYSMIDLAHGLNVEVVAEGVETKDQLDLLSQKGCDQIQGFLFSKPVPEIEFRKLLEKGYIELDS